MDISGLADLLLSKLDGYDGDPMFPMSDKDLLMARLRAVFGNNVLCNNEEWNVCGKFLTTAECEDLLAEIAKRETP